MAKDTELTKVWVENSKKNYFHAFDKVLMYNWSRHMWVPCLYARRNWHAEGDEPVHEVMGIPDGPAVMSDLVIPYEGNETSMHLMEIFDKGD